MRDNIIEELEQEKIDIIKEYSDENKLSSDWFPIRTYDMVQAGYPIPDHGVMIARDWGGTDGEGKLLPASSMWCKVEDVKNEFSWISIKDQLPEIVNIMGVGNKYSDDVLITDGENYYIGFLESVRPTHERLIWSNSNDEIIDNVTHWMKIPKLFSK